MKTAVLLLAAASAVLAQNFEGQPPCATDCLSSAISAAGCDADDIGCQCGPTQVAIAASAAPCLIESCTGTLVLDAQSAGEAQCSSYFATAFDTTAATIITTATVTDEETSTVTDEQTSTVTDEATTTTTSDDDSSQTTEPPNPDETTDGANDDTPATTETSTGAAAAATPIIGAGALLGVLGAFAAM